TGSERGLYAAWCFDTPGTSGPQTPKPLTRRLDTRRTRARPEVASLDRDHRADAKLLDVPDPKARMQLPFPVDEAWEVIQGVDQPGGSHNSYAAFCWDFVLAGRPAAESKGLPLHA